jgi:uncharacterized protein (TIRG00374 family)
MDASAMTYEIRISKRTAALFLTAGLLLFLMYLYFFVDFGEFLDTLERANPLYYSLAASCLFLGTAFYSLAWQGLLRLVSVKVSFLKAFQYIWIGSFVDLLVPAESVSGDISRVYLVSRDDEDKAGRVVASVVSQRLLSGFVLFIGFFVSSVYFIFMFRPTMLVQQIIVIVLALSVVFQGLLFYLCTRKHATERLVNWLVNLLVRVSRGRWHFDHLRASAMKMLTAFHDGIAMIGQQPKRLVLPILLTVSAWLFDLLLVVFVWLSLGSFGVTVSLSLIMVVYSIGAGLQAVPIGIPAEIGVFEIVMTSVYAFFGVPIALSAVATLLTRFLTLWTKLLVGGVAVQWLGFKELTNSTAKH